MPQPSEAADAWLFTKKLAEVDAAELVQAIRLHVAANAPPPPQNVREVLALGDWLIELGTRANGEQHVKQLIQEGTLSATFVHQRRWLSRTVPIKLKGLLDAEGISVGHLRALATLPEPESRGDYAELVAGIQAGKVKVRDILDRVPRKCAGPECRVVLLDEDRLKDSVVQVILGKYRRAHDPDAERDQQRKFFCGPRCASLFLDAVDRGLIRIRDRRSQL